jgi:hypothetical protein
MTRCGDEALGVVRCLLVAGACRFLGRLSVGELLASLCSARVLGDLDDVCP